jgi:hypothetical protein
MMSSRFIAGRDGGAECDMRMRCGFTTAGTELAEMNLWKIQWPAKNPAADHKRTQPTKAGRRKAAIVKAVLPDVAGTK